VPLDNFLSLWYNRQKGVCSVNLTVEAVHVNRREGKAEVYVTLLNDEGIAVGVNMLKFTDGWGSSMSELLAGLVLPHIEELYLRHGVPVNGLGREDETWKAIVRQLE
jgi:hypothetical protein